MKPDKYNTKAREAYGKSLIDIGVAIFKSILLLIFVVPIAAVLKSVFIGGANPASFFEILDSLPISTKAIIIGLISLAFFAGHIIRKEGLRHIHEIENKT